MNDPDPVAVQEHFWRPRAPAKEEGRVTPRPAGVFWAHTGGRTDGWLCERPEHDVYVRRVRRPARGVPGQWASLWVFACAVCWPPRGGNG